MTSQSRFSALLQLISRDVPNFKVVHKVCAAAQRSGNHGRTKDGLNWQVALLNFTNFYFILKYTFILYRHNCHYFVFVFQLHWKPIWSTTTLCLHASLCTEMEWVTDSCTAWSTMRFHRSLTPSSPWDTTTCEFFHVQVLVFKSPLKKLRSCWLNLQCADTVACIKLLHALCVIDMENSRCWNTSNANRSTSDIDWFECGPLCTSFILVAEWGSSLTKRTWTKLKLYC